MKIEFGKKTAAAFCFLIGYAMVQGVCYGVWGFNGYLPGYSFAVWMPTVATGVIFCITGIVAGASS